MGQEGDICIMIESAQKLADESNPISKYVSHHISLSLLIEVDKKKNCTAIENNSTHFTRLFLSGDLEALPLGSEGSEPIKLLKDRFELIQLLKDRRNVMASKIEEFFIILPKELWLRTIFICKDKVAPEGSHFLSPISYDNVTIQSIQSNVVPCQQYWEKLQDARKNYEADSTNRDTDLGISHSKLEAHLKNTREVAILEEHSVCELMKQTIGGTNSGTHTRPFLKIEPNDVNDSNELNDELSGSDGTVKIMLWRGGRFASKFFEKSYEELFFRELRVRQEIGNHPHIVYVFGVSIPESDGLLQYWMELLDTNLFLLSVELNRSKTPFGSMDSMDILLQIAKAMEHLHEKNVVHGDLKPGNVLISPCGKLGDVEQYIVKVADFDRSQILPSNDLDSFELSLGTRAYAPPEFSNATEIPVNALGAKKSDVYPFGLLAWGVLTGNTAYLEETQATILVKRDFIVANLNECSEKYHKGLINLIRSCLSIKPADRPSFAELTKVLKFIIEQTESATEMRPRKRARIRV